MNRITLATTLVAATAAFAAPAFAQSAQEVAIMHFNMSADNDADTIMEPVGDIMTTSLDMNSSLADAFSEFNMDADNTSQLRGESGTVTVIASNPAHAAEIFRRLMAADDDN